MVGTVLEGGVEPRYPTLKGRMAAKKVEIEHRTPTSAPVGSSRVQLKLPPPAPSSVEILGESPEGAAPLFAPFEKRCVRCDRCRSRVTRTASPRSPWRRSPSREPSPLPV